MVRLKKRQCGDPMWSKIPRICCLGLWGRLVVDFWFIEAFCVLVNGDVSWWICCFVVTPRDWFFCCMKGFPWLMFVFSETFYVLVYGESLTYLDPVRKSQQFSNQNVVHSPGSQKILISPAAGKVPRPLRISSRCPFRICSMFPPSSPPNSPSCSSKFPPGSL